jgi:hypothetical protein
MKHDTFPKFRLFHDSLVRAAVSKGIVWEDAQDLAGGAVEKALAGFDPAKGEFSAYCHTILANLIKNYWRDKKKTDEFVEDGYVVPESAIDPVELAETLREVRSALSEIAKSLSTEENAFLNHLQDVLDESGPRAISEAARRSGLTPAKGWDLFRKIQRKARAVASRLAPEGRTSSEPTISPAPVMVEKGVGMLFEMRISDPLSQFTVEQCRMVEKLLP